jgi:DNA polymerase-3 subunit beta
MQVVVRRASLLEACKLAEKAVAVRPVDPVLTNLLLEASEGACFLSATDRMVGVRLPVPGQVEQGGQALVPARQFLGILREAPEEELAIRAEPGRVWVRGGDAEFELRSDDASLFPAIPSFPDGLADELPAEALRLAIERTLFAAGKDESAHSVRGILWEVEADRVRLVATDNRRLAVAELPARARREQAGPQQALVRVEAMQVLERLSALLGGPVRALFGARQVFFRAESATVCSRLLDSPFPPWRRALAGEPRYRLLLPVGPFLAGVRQAAVLRDRADTRVLLRFQGGRVTLRSRQPGTGRARVQQALVLPCVREPVEVAFNPTYLAEMLRVLDAQATVQLQLRDPDAPALFCAGDDYKHVLMPLRSAPQPIEQ